MRTLSSHTSGRVLRENGVCQLSLRAGVPQLQYIDRFALNFVANFILSCQNAPHLTWLELKQLFANARIG